MNTTKKRVALYCRVSTLDQHSETQLIELRQAADQRGWEMIGTYTDHGISGARDRRPQHDQMLSDAGRESASSARPDATQRLHSLLIG